MAEINTDLFEMSEGSDPSAVKAVMREQHISLLMKNLFGSTISFATLHGVEIEVLTGFFIRPPGNLQTVP